MDKATRRSFLNTTLATTAAAAMASAASTVLTEANAAETVARKAKTSAFSRERLSALNSLIMLVDHQTGTIDWVKSLPKETVITSCRVLAKMSLAYGIPLVLTTTLEEYVGPTIKDIQEIAPDAFAKRYKRGGQLSCWDDPALLSGVKSIGRKNIIMAGLTTDICLFWAAYDALGLGYKVTVVADACGTMSTLGDQLTYDRLRGMGVTVTVANQLVTELVNNFGNTEGQKAQKIMNDEIISKLNK